MSKGISRELAARRSSIRAEKRDKNKKRSPFGVVLVYFSIIAQAAFFVEQEVVLGSRFNA